MAASLHKDISSHLTSSPFFSVCTTHTSHCASGHFCLDQCFLPFVILGYKYAAQIHTSSLDVLFSLQFVTNNLVIQKSSNAVNGQIHFLHLTMFINARLSKKILEWWIPLCTHYDGYICLVLSVIISAATRVGTVSWRHLSCKVGFFGTEMPRGRQRAFIFHLFNHLKLLN